MPSPDIQGRSILIVDDEPLIALELANAFEQAGAQVTMTHTLHQALNLAAADGLSAAILDHKLHDGDTSQLCELLKERGIPFVTYSGYPNAEGQTCEAPHISKPADPSVLVTVVTELLA
jgi:DNA-binding response OmpR family regulator